MQPVPAPACQHARCCEESLGCGAPVEARWKGQRVSKPQSPLAYLLPDVTRLGAVLTSKAAALSKRHYSPTSTCSPNVATASGAEQTPPIGGLRSLLRALSSAVVGVYAQPVPVWAPANKPPAPFTVCLSVQALILFPSPGSSRFSFLLFQRNSTHTVRTCIYIHHSCKAAAVGTLLQRSYIVLVFHVFSGIAARLPPRPLDPCQHKPHAVPGQLWPRPCLRVRY